MPLWEGIEPQTGTSEGSGHGSGRSRTSVQPAPVVKVIASRATVLTSETAGNAGGSIDHASTEV